MIDYYNHTMHALLFFSCRRNDNIIIFSDVVFALREYARHLKRYYTAISSSLGSSNFHLKAIY